MWASCQVQKDFEELFALLVSESFLDYFIHKYPMEYHDILQELKTKMHCTPSDSQKVTIKMPAFLMEKFKRKTGKSIEKAVQKTIMKGHMEFKLDKCKMAPEIFQSLFTDAAKHIVNYMKEELLSRFPDAEYIILIGEFAQSPILQDIIKASFPTKNILIPQEARMTAIKGAVCLGQKPVALATIVSKLLMIIYLICENRTIILLCTYISVFKSPANSNWYVWILKNKSYRLVKENK